MTQPADLPPRLAGAAELGRALTAEEKRAYAKLLRAHDWPKARVIALAFAYRLSRNRAVAEDVLGRADLEIVRQGWDPNKVTLVKALCRFVWVEWGREKRERAQQRRAEEIFLANQRALASGLVRSSEQELLDKEAERQQEERERQHLAGLRAMFEEAGDQVNLIWMDYTARGEDDLEKMARETGRLVPEFYDAADRRKRAIRRLIAGLRGVPSREKD